MFIPAEKNIKPFSSTDVPLSSMRLCPLASRTYETVTDGLGFNNLHSYMQMIQSQSGGKKRFWNI